MIYNQNRRIIFAFYAAVASVIMLTGFTSLAAENRVTERALPGKTVNAETSTEETDVLSGKFDVTDQDAVWKFPEIVSDVHAHAVNETKEAAGKAGEIFRQKAAEEEERKAREEAERLAAEEAEKELLAALIFCEAGNQPYEGQVAVGAVVMNRVESGSFPDTISSVIYQSGQFTPAMTGWLDSVLANEGYTDSAMQAAEDALSGSNPVGSCLYFSTGGGGYQLGDHYFR